MDYHHVFTYLSSQETARELLKNCYQKVDPARADIKSYENCQSFLYYINHGIRFFENGENVELFARPLLYFYGIAHFLKGLTLTKRPDYPESTTQLAHGVTTRKRKKKNYSFGEDEVKIQHNGFLPYFSKHLYAIADFPFQKIKTGYLLKVIPEMNAFFSWMRGETMIEVSTLHSRYLHFPSYLAANYHLTEEAFLRRIQGYVPEIKKVKTTSGYLKVELAEGSLPAVSPFFLHQENKGIYFPGNRENFLALPETVIHYLLLYHLSMLSRYETAWWGDLLGTKPDNEYVLIKGFLDVAAKKVPTLIADELLHLLETNL